MMIEPVKQHDLDECIDLISRTFDRFVAGDCTEKGIGRQLFKYVLQETKIKHPEITEMTVNSSSYAEKIYEQLGFKRTGDIQEKDGIWHIPMKYAIQEFQLEKQE
jgi:predicted GNAT family N-acyltransferase